MNIKLKTKQKPNIQIGDFIEDENEGLWVITQILGTGKVTIYNLADGFVSSASYPTVTELIERYFKGYHKIRHIKSNKMTIVEED